MIKTAVLMKDGSIPIVNKKKAIEIQKSYTGMIVACSKPNCFLPAHVIDAYFPYYTEGNLCKHHYDIYLKWFREFM